MDQADLTFDEARPTISAVLNKILTDVAVLIGLGINFAFWIGFVWMIALAADHGPEVWSLG